MILKLKSINETQITDPNSKVTRVAFVNEFIVDMSLPQNKEYLGGILQLITEERLSYLDVGRNYTFPLTKEERVDKVRKEEKVKKFKRASNGQAHVSQGV